MIFDSKEILTGVILSLFGVVSMLIGAATIWLFTSVLKLKRDMDHAFIKLRGKHGKSDHKNDNGSCN